MIRPKFLIVLCIAFFYSGAVFGLVQDNSDRIVAETVQSETSPQETEGVKKDINDIKEGHKSLQAEIERIDRTAQAYEFIIKLLATLSPIMLALIAWLQIRSQKASEYRDMKRGENLQSIEKSIDGMQTKVVAVATAAGFEEGAALDIKHAAGRAIYKERSAELKEEVKASKIDQKAISDQSKEDMIEDEI